MSRIAALKSWVETATSSEAEQALVDDGWPRAMAHAGLAMHRQTWDVERIQQACFQEAGGVQAFQAFCDGLHNPVGHIWPMLPGAGMTPVLYMALAGRTQYVRISATSPGNYHRLILTSAPPSIRQVDDIFETNSRAIVVSGSDLTIKEVRAMTSAQVVGYGHRISFCVTDGTQPEAIARDVVMWNQMGCFSTQAVFYAGPKNNLEAFAAALAKAIEAQAIAWGANNLNDQEAAARVQARGIAEFSGVRLFDAGPGWVESTSTSQPWRDTATPKFVVKLMAVESPKVLSQVVEVPPRNLQGAAMAFASEDAAAPWIRACRLLGATRIAEAGTMQSPPPEWEHDGMPNLGVIKV